MKKRLVILFLLLLAAILVLLGICIHDAIRHGYLTFRTEDREDTFDKRKGVEIDPAPSPYGHGLIGEIRHFDETGDRESESGSGPEKPERTVHP